MTHTGVKKTNEKKIYCELSPMISNEKKMSVDHFSVPLKLIEG